MEKINKIRVEIISQLFIFCNNIALGTKIKMSESERFAHMFAKSIGLVRKWSEIKVRLMAA